jgi:hypothetical protein
MHRKACLSALWASFSASVSNSRTSDFIGYSCRSLQIIVNSAD